MSTAEKLGFYATPAHECSYLPDREAITIFADPRFPKNTRLYSALADCGFRRSGEHLYMPNCKNCNSCISVRIPVADFILSRNQQRTWNKNRDIVVTTLPPKYREEHFLLYKKYLESRHRGGGMDDPKPENYMDFLTSQWSETVFFEMRLEDKLVGIAVADIMENAMSAVYTFFDPDFNNRSLGRFAVLYQLEQAKIMGLRWLYLGYWIEECKKMNYKNEYQPLEYFVGNVWISNLNTNKNENNQSS